MILRRGALDQVRVSLGAIDLEGTIELPALPRGVVVFAHGSGSSQYSPRNQYVARQLREANLGTFLVDLLTKDEDQDRALRFDIRFLAERLGRITEWVRGNLAGSALRIGYFGASTGAAAALEASVAQPGSVAAIVSRGGRPDLASDALPQVEAPTLFIVGANDEPVTSLNIEAYKQLRSTRELVVIPGATHLFEERGALEQVARLAADWFSRYLPAPSP